MLIMPDEYDFGHLDDLIYKLHASPALLKAWRASSSIEYSYAWYLLNHSWQLSPEVPVEYTPHNPRLKIWDDANGWTDNNPNTLIVFLGPDERVLCRHAVWHCKQTGEIKPRLIDFIEQDGQVQFHPPNITFTDAEVPFSPLQKHLETIAAQKVSAISLQTLHKPSVTSDAGSIGFEFFSQDQPPSSVRYTWSVDTPPEWEPVISEIKKLREFLLCCFK